jgi:transposase
VVYRRSHDIEMRLEEMLRLIRVGGYATPALAKTLRVSIPTVSRCVTALRERGHDIRAVKHADGWQYVLLNAEKRRGQKSKHMSSDVSGATRP